MKEYDFHRMNIEEADYLLDQIIGRIRMDGESEDVRLITGRGKIMNFLLQRLEEEDLYHNVELGNTGAIFVTVE